LGRGGNERFGPPAFFAAGGRAVRLAAGDFNGDGKPDIAVSLDDDQGLPNGRLAILLNDGTGKFGAPNIIDLTGDPVTPFIADLNNDGKLDIDVGLSTGTTDGRVAVLLGNGAGSFAPAPNSPLTTFTQNTGVIAMAITTKTTDAIWQYRRVPAA
jgi:N-acyl-D-aspartate/D-glutamate deacylase